MQSRELLPLLLLVRSFFFGGVLRLAGKMTMVGMYTAGVTYDVTGKGFDPEVGLHFGKVGKALNNFHC